MSTCVCCGYKTLEDDGGHWICEICFWQDEPSCWRNPRFIGWLNGESLYKAQKNFMRISKKSRTLKREARFGGFERIGRAPAPDDEFDKDWEPFLKNYEHFR